MCVKQYIFSSPNYYFLNIYYIFSIGTPNTQVVQLPIVDSIAPRPPYLPLSIPKDLAPRISRLHGNPFVWWVGQFFKFLLRPQLSTKTMLDSAAEKLGFKKPIVG